MRRLGRATWLCPDSKVASERCECCNPDGEDSGARAGPKGLDAPAIAGGDLGDCLAGIAREADADVCRDGSLQCCCCCGCLFLLTYWSWQV